MMKTALLSLMLVGTVAACGGATKTVDLGDPDSRLAGAGDTTPTVKPAVETVLSGQSTPGHIAVGGEHLFFAAAHDIVRYDLAAQRRVDLGLRISSPTFVSDAHTFFAADKETIGDGAGAKIVGSPLPGCSLQECDGFVARWEANVGGRFVALAMDATHVYWISEGAAWSYTLRRAPKQGGDGGVVTSEVVAEWSELSPTQLVVDDGAIWIGASHELLRVDKNTKQLRLALDGGPGWISADATHLWWVVSRDRDVFLTRFDKATGEVEETTLPEQAYDHTVRLGAVGTNAVYVMIEPRHAVSAEGKIVRFLKTTKERTDVATGLSQTQSFALAGGYVYWSNPTGGTIQRLYDF